MSKYDSVSRRSGKVVAGLVIIGVGVILLLKQLGYFFPDWLFSWPVILIVVGLVIGFQQQFRNPAWIVLLIIGALFLLDRLFPGIGLKGFIAPILVIGFGLWMMLGRNHRRKLYHSTYEEVGKEQWYEKMGEHWREEVIEPSATPGSGEFMNAVSVFGGVKKTVLSKNFMGGDIVTFMGGMEINLSQADIQGRVRLDVTQVMGGTTIIIPPHWDVISEMTAVFGGIEDKRVLQANLIDPTKVLVIEGTSLMGGIIFKSY
jgi:predicted membrane protein